MTVNTHGNESAWILPHPKADRNDVGRKLAKRSVLTIANHAD